MAETAHLKCGKSEDILFKKYVPVLSFLIVISEKIGSIPEDAPAIKLVVPVGAMVNKVIFRLGCGRFLHASGTPNFSPKIIDSSSAILYIKSKTNSKMSKDSFEP